MTSCCLVPNREEAPSVSRCPVCGQPAKKVKRLTVEALLRPAAVPQIGATQYYFCETTACSVVYFPYDDGAALFRQSDLAVRVGLKQTADPVPLCYCFGITQKDVRKEIQETGTSTAVQRIKTEVQAGNCTCETKNPSGKCCLGNVTQAVQQALRTFRSVAVSD